MRNFNFLSKSSSQSCGHSSVTLAMTVGSPSAHRRGIMLKLLSVLVLVLTFGVGQMWGDEIYKTCEFSKSNSSGNSDYTKSVTVTSGTDTWTATNAANNNKGWAYIKLGKKNSSSNQTTNITTGAAYSVAITKVVLTTTAINSSYVSSMKLQVASNSNFTSNLAEYSIVVPTKAGAHTFDVTTPTANRYYRVVIVHKNTTNGNGAAATITKVDYYHNACTNSVTVTTPSATNGTISGATSLATCSDTDADRRVTITVTPSSGYGVPTNLTLGGSITPLKVTGPTSNGAGAYTYVYQFAQNANGSTSFSATCPELAKYTVQFSTGEGNPTKDALTEASAGAGITLPAAVTPHCSGWTFAGWSETNVSSETTTAPTLLDAETTYHPATNCTLYAVYSRSETGDPVPAKLSASYSSSTGWTVSNCGGSSYWILKSGASITSPVISDLSTVKSITFSARTYGGADYKTINAKTSGNVNVGSTDATSATMSSGYSISVSGLTGSGSLVLSSSTTSSANGPGINNIEINYITTPSTTYYLSAPDCCDPLGSINGSIDMNQNSAVLTWDDLEGVAASNPYAVTYRKGSEAYGSTNVGEITTNAQGKKTCTITGLECGTEYDFKIAVTGDGSHCDAEQVLEDKSTTKWSITYNLTNTVALSEGPTQGANACGEITASFTKDGLYTFPAEISVTIGGNAATVNEDYMWNDGVLSIDAAKVTGDVAVTIAGVAPANPIVTPSPVALSFAQVKKGAAIPTAQDIAITGHNLTAALTVTSSNPSLYAVSVKSGSLTPDGNKDASPVITVTPQEGITSTAGDKNATITISGGGLAADVVVNVTFNVQETYTVNWYVNGTKIDANSKTDVEGTAVTAPSDFSTFTDCSELTFVGWKEGSAIAGGSSTAAPSLAEVVTTIPATDKNYYAVFAEGTAGGTSWNEVALANLTSSDVFVIVGNNGSTYAMTNNNGTSSAPAATSVTIANNTITSEVVNNIKWNISGDATNGYTFYPNGSTTTWLYCTSTNNGVRVGTNDNKTFKPDNAGYLKNEGTSRYVGIYDSQDWRCYTSNTGTSNIKDQTFAYYKYTETAPNFKKWYTTCPHVARVTLSAAEVSNGSISFEQSGSAVTNVRTDGGEDVEVDVVPDPATGYELTGVALSGTAASHASYDAGVITIDAGTEGALTATATFAQANYTVTMAQTGGASAELSADQTNKHYNDVITVTAENKAGYVFKGWSASPAVTFANAKALSTTFSMPNGNVTVTAAYEVIHDVAWALANTPGSGSSDSVYVKGLISKKEKLESDNTISYWISDNGQHTTGSVLEVYKGRGVNKVTFSSLDDLNVGDAVVVRGKLKTFNSTKEFDSGNYMYSRTAAAVASVAIGGSAEKTAYSPSDNTFSFAGLTATATYNTGYVKDVTAEATWTANSANSYTVAATGNVTVKAAFGGQYDEEVVGVTYTTKTVKEIYLEYESTYTFKGMDLPKPKVYAKYVEEIDDDEITSLVEAANGYDTESTYNKNTPDNYTIKVEYESFNAEYIVQVRKIFDNEDAPHNVADANVLITAVGTSSASTDYMWVRGKVSGFNGTSIKNYYISDDGTSAGQLYVFNGSYFNGVAFTDANKLKVGDEVILKTKIQIYSSTNELTGSQVTYQLRDPAFAFADVVEGDEFEPNFSADMTVEPTSNEGNAAFTLSSGNTDAVTIVAGKLHAVAEGDAVITASRAATDNTGSINYKAKNVTFNVHVIAERTRYAITMDKNGGSGTDPVYDNQLAGATVDLPADNTYSKANSVFDAWVVTETVSGDAVAVTDGHFTMPAAAVTIKATWNDVETCHISFQVSGGEVATAEAPQTVAYSLAEVSHLAVDGFTFLGWSETEYADETTTLPTMIESYTPALNESNKTLYGIYSQVVGGVTNKHYVLDYAEEGLGSNTNWGAYSTAYDYTAADGGEWTIKAYKSSGIQINTGRDAYIKVPDCAADIIQISLTCNSTAKAAVKFAGSTDGDALATGTESTSQTLDLSGNSVTTGYILPSGNCQITHIDVEYSGNVTYYTSSPITRYNVTYAKGDAENVTGLCAADRLAAGSITLCDAPTSDDKNFAKWSDGVSLYAAGAEYTLSADVTLIATWTPKPTYNVTYNTSGSQGTTPTDATNYYEGDEVTLASASGLSNAGYFFDQWVATYVDNNSETQTLVIEDGKFTMPAFNVTVTATWARKSSDKWIKVTATSQLAADKEYIIVNTDATYAVGAQGSNNRTAAAIEENNGILTISDAVAKFTLGIPEASKYTFENGGKYIYASSSTKNYLHEQTKNDANGVWTISIGEEGAATVTATGENTRNIMRYNPNNGSPMFSCYASNSSVQNPVVLYYKAPKIEINDNESVNVSDAAPGSDVVIHDGGVLVINEAASIGDLTVENGGKVTLSKSNKLTVVGTFTIETTMASGNSGQLNGATESNFEAGEAYIDITLGAGGTNQQWHAFTVPFPVDVMNGIYDLDGNKLTNEVNYAIMDYHGDIRATGAYGWKKIRTTLVPGTFYIMATDGYRTTYRFKKKAGEPLVAENSKQLYKFEESGDGVHGTDNGWNGIGNPNLFYGKVNLAVQVLDPMSYTFVTKTAQSTNFVVGTPFFYQATANGSMVMETANAGGNYAPARERAIEIKDVPVSFGNEDFNDYLYVTANEDALNEYETGKDLAKMTMTNTPKVAQIFGKAYNTKLCMVHAPMVNNQAEVALELYAPQAGVYTISVPTEREDATLYLTYEGNIIWDLTVSPYEAEFDKGQNNGYGLLLVRKAPQVTTGMETVDNSQSTIHNCQKVILNDHVYILRDAQLYDVTGKAVK